MSQLTKERNAKLRAAIQLKYHNGSTYDKKFDGYCHVEMPNIDRKTLEYIHGEKSLKVLFIIYDDLEYLLEKIDSCQITLKNLT